MSSENLADLTSNLSTYIFHRQLETEAKEKFLELMFLPIPTEEKKIKTEKIVRIMRKHLREKTYLEGLLEIKNL